MILETCSRASCVQLVEGLRAALAERDAEIAGWKADQKENLANQCELQRVVNEHRDVFEQALAELIECRSVDDNEHGRQAAITAIQEILK